MLKKYWLEHVERISNPGGIARFNVKEYESDWQNTVARAVHEELRELDIKQKEEIEKRLIDKIQSSNAVGSYNRIAEEFYELIDLRKQEVWADFVERFRLLLFRVLTAVGIATVVLVTGYIANKLGIPLPLLRIPA